jgi:uncharacterized protein (DUF885 family)
VADPEAVLQAAVQHIIGWPAHSLAYPVGAAEFPRLRREAEAALGSRLDLRAFHDLVLEDGRITLGMLREKVHRWIAEKR